MKIKTCKYCLLEKEYKNIQQFASHVRSCNKNPKYLEYNKKISEALKGHKGHSVKGHKGHSVKGHKFPLGHGRASTEEKELIRREKISKKMKEVGGGYRKGSGRGKKGWYKGIFCDSSWELAYVIYCLDNKINIARNTNKYKYEFDGITRNYIPDFIVNDEIIEIKGYETPQWKAKISKFSEIKVIDKYGIQFYLKYAIDKYGKDFIKMYE